MYLPAGKYKVLYSQGEIKNSDGTPYAGPYIKTYDNRYFQGDSIERPGPALVEPTPPPPRPRPDPLPPVQGSGGLYTPEGRKPFQDIYKTVDELFHTLYISPSEQDYSSTVYNRYIVQNRSNRQIVETTEFRYIQLTSNGYRGVVVPWKILGPKNNLVYNNKLFRGTSEQNTETLNRLQNTIPEIKQFLNDPTQFTRTPERVTAIEQATGNKVILRTADFVLVKYQTVVSPEVPTVGDSTYVLPGYVVIGYVV